MSLSFARWKIHRDSVAKATHLLLDGGRLHVPNEASGDFLNGYAVDVVRKTPLNVVELRTPVFRLFFDLDIKLNDRSQVPDVMRHMQQLACDFFDVPEPRVVELTTPTVDKEGFAKRGVHLVWTNVYVTPATALAFRAVAVESLTTEHEGACANSWEDVVDKCVFTRNGLRMPWSTKGRAGSAVYTPARLLEGDAESAVPEISGVSATREWIRQLSIRAFEPESPLKPGVAVHEDIEELQAATIPGKRRSLAEFGVLDDVVKCLPEEYQGTKVTGVIETESCFILKTDSRWCMNVGRCHNSSSTFFVLTLRGVRCGCFCRKEDDADRAWGRCRDYRSDFYDVPLPILRTFFAAAGDFKPTKLPSVLKSQDNLGANARPTIFKPPRKKRASKASRNLIGRMPFVK